MENNECCVCVGEEGVVVEVNYKISCLLSLAVRVPHILLHSREWHALVLTTVD